MIKRLTINYKTEEKDIDGYDHGNNAEQCRILAGGVDALMTANAYSSEPLIERNIWEFPRIAVFEYKKPIFFDEELEIETEIQEYIKGRGLNFTQAMLRGGSVVTSANLRFNLSGEDYKIMMPDGKLLVEGTSYSKIPVAMSNRLLDTSGRIRGGFHPGIFEYGRVDLIKTRVDDGEGLDEKTLVDRGIGFLVRNATYTYALSEPTGKEVEIHSRYLPYERKMFVGVEQKMISRDKAIGKAELNYLFVKFNGNGEAQAIRPPKDLLKGAGFLE